MHAQVNINRNAVMTEGKGLTYPHHKIIGIMPDERSAWDATNDLLANGFVEHDLELWSGSEGIEALKNSFDADGPLGAFKGILQEFGDEAQNLRTYEKALSEGEFLLVAPISNEDEKTTCNRVLAAHGGHFVLYYGELTIETLTANRVIG